MISICDIVLLFKPFVFANLERRLRIVRAGIIVCVIGADRFVVVVVVVVVVIVFIVFVGCVLSGSEFGGIAWSHILHTHDPSDDIILILDRRPHDGHILLLRNVRLKGMLRFLVAALFLDLST